MRTRKARWQWICICLFCLTVIGSSLSISVAQTSAPPLAAAGNPSVPPSAQGSEDSRVAALSKVSESAIAAATASVEQIKWIFSVASLVVTVLIGVIGFLGYQNVRGISETIREEARSRIDRELKEFTGTVQTATQLALRTQAAMRQVYLAEKWSESSESQRQNFRNAIEAIKEARNCASTLADRATEGWTYIFEAYCLRGLKRYSEAIAQQLAGMNLLERSDPLDYYNLGCFYALVNNESAAKVNLARAIELGGELYRRHATRDADLAPMRDAGKLKGLIETDTSAVEESYIAGLDGPPPPAGASPIGKV